MKNLNRIADYLLEWASGSAYALISMIIGAGAILISLSLYPGYDMVIQFVSFLGIGPGLSAPFFNIGLILAGIIALPYFISLGRIFEQEDNGNENIKKRALQVSIVMCLSLSLIGCFPAINTMMLILHGGSAVVFFLAGLSFCILSSYLMIKDSRFSRSQATIGFIMAGLFIVYIFTFQPLIEWILFFGITFWIIESAIYIFIKKL